MRAATAISICFLGILGGQCSFAGLNDSRRPALPASHVGKILVDPSIRLRALWDGRKSVDFKAANYPTAIPASRARFLRDDEYVLGLTINGESRAYPTRLLSWHHIVNDQVGKADRGGKAFVTVTY